MMVGPLLKLYSQKMPGKDPTIILFVSGTSVNDDKST